jgi:hypothetical protein
MGRGSSLRVGKNPHVASDLHVEELVLALTAAWRLLGPRFLVRSVLESARCTAALGCGVHVSVALPQVIESLEARFMDNVIHLCFAAAFGRLHSVKMAFHRGQALLFR